MDIPGHGHVDGEWDLRAGAREFLGGVAFAGKRVLEVGKASGFLTFHMEKEGADVLAYDLSENHVWDYVPYAGLDQQRYRQEIRRFIWRLNNGFWLAHRAIGSKARLVHGTVYQMPDSIGPVDIVVVTALLLHLRDPFLALQQALRFARETVIIADLMPEPPLDRMDGPFARFFPDSKKGEPRECWWELSIETIRRFIGVLGFEKSTVTYHHQATMGKRVRCYTIVGSRTVGPR
jgi:hypothetical protein